MYDLVTWPRSPWSILDALESLQGDMNRALSGADAGGTPRVAASTYPLVNVWAAEDGLVVDAELPGVEPKDVDISVVGDELTIRGAVNAADEGTEDTFVRRERPAGTFSRTFQLPFRADGNGVKAVYKNGVLRLTVPRHEEEKPKKIAVEAA